MADAVGCAIPSQQTPQGYYNIARMLKAIGNKDSRIKCCASCMDARGLESMTLINGAERSTMQELTKLTLAAEKALTV